MPRADRDSGLGIGLALAYRGMTLGVEFALPAVAGYAADRRWHTAPLLTLVGATLGFAAGMWHLLRISSGGPKPGRDGGVGDERENRSS